MNNKNLTKRVNFKNVEVTNLEGEKLRFDLSKSFGNHIYQTTGDLGLLEVAQSIYKEGEAELNPDIRKELISVVKEPTFPFLAIIKKWLLEQLS